MKIAEAEKQLGIQYSPEKSGSAQQSEPGQFIRILQSEIMQGENEVSGVDQSAGIASPVLPGAVYSNTLQEGAFNQQVYEALASGLEKLEALEKAMGDPSTNLRSIDELFNNLSGAIAEMGEFLEDLPGEHPIRAMADELNVLTYVESVKWKRGDYL